MRVRFAPSPTGHLHIGGARTALFDWLLARQTDGTFILRIEDTDPERSKREYEEQILRDMRWLGLTWDEGPETGGDKGPYRQSERMDHYLPWIDKLLASGKAYRCNATKDELDAMRTAQKAAGENPRYDGRNREANLGADCGDHVIRIKLPVDGSTAFDDLCKGTVEIANTQLDDFIILRTDGTPTYNFVVVVDDLEMEVSHVIRGDDHVNNTPKQIHIYEAFGVQTPTFGHLPMILGEDGSRLSKRHGATALGAYRDMGILPEAMMNYLARLGWAHGDQEVFTAAELIEHFSLRAVNKAGARWDMDKLLWLNQTWMKALEIDDLAARARPFFEAEGVTPDERLPAVVATVRERANNLVDMAKAGAFYFRGSDELSWDDKSVRKFLKAEAAPVVEALIDMLTATDWTEPALETAVKEFCEARDLGLGKVAPPIRVSMTGCKVGPGLYEMLLAMGKDESISRLRGGLSRCGSVPPVQ